VKEIPSAAACDLFPLSEALNRVFSRSSKSYQKIIYFASSRVTFSEFRVFWSAEPSKNVWL
jgi:hypothetical protein